MSDLPVVNERFQANSQSIKNCARCPKVENSVVNEWGRSHDVRNLFIVDGSIFVTSAGVNPTSTIQALALYVADQMKSRLANLFD